MTKDHSKKDNDLTRLMKELKDRIPGTMDSFNKPHSAAVADGVLTTKTKELIALGIAITVRCDGCIAFHVHDAMGSGASAEEILETIGVAVLMGGGPSVVYGCEAMQAMDQFVVLEKNEGYA